MISSDTKTDVKQEIEELVAPSSLIMPVKNRGQGEKVLLNNQKLLCMTKVIY